MERYIYHERIQISMGQGKQLRIDEVLSFEYPDNSFEKILELARTKYRTDENVQTWLSLYEEGSPKLKIKKGNKKEVLAGIPPHSEFAKKGLRKAITLRESGGVFIMRKPTKKSSTIQSEQSIHSKITPGKLPGGA